MANEIVYGNLGIPPAGSRYGIVDDDYDLRRSFMEGIYTLDPNRDGKLTRDESGLTQAQFDALNGKFELFKQKLDRNTRVKLTPDNRDIKKKNITALYQQQNEIFKHLGIKCVESWPEGKRKLWGCGTRSSLFAMAEASNLLTFSDDNRNLNVVVVAVRRFMTHSRYNDLPDNYSLQELKNDIMRILLTDNHYKVGPGKPIIDELIQKFKSMKHELNQKRATIALNVMKEVGLID